MILLLLLSLCVTECRVHRNLNAYEGCTFNLAGPAVCQNPSHWLPCTVQEKCDTVWYYKERWAGFWYVTDSIPDIRCHPDTLVDSGGKAPRVGGLLPMVGVVTDTIRVWDLAPGLDSAELSDIREMLREWRVARCVWDAIAHSKENGSWWWGEVDDRKLRDSCECVNGGVK